MDIPFLSSGPRTPLEVYILEAMNIFKDLTFTIKALYTIREISEKSGWLKLQKFGRQILNSWMAEPVHYKCILEKYMPLKSVSNLWKVLPWKKVILTQQPLLTHFGHQFPAHHSKTLCAFVSCLPRDAQYSPRLIYNVSVLFCGWPFFVEELPWFLEVP